MGLIYCSECGKQISDKAKVCPYCGAPRKKHPLGNFFDSWNTLLPNEKTSIKKSLIYTLISVSLMLIFLYAPVWFGLVHHYDNLLLDLFFSNTGDTDKISDKIVDFYLRKLLTTLFLSLVWYVLLFICIIKTYLKSGLDGKKPICSHIGLVRCVVFCVICIIACVHYAKAYFAFFESFEFSSLDIFSGAIVAAIMSAMGNLAPIIIFFVANCKILAFSFFAFIAALEIAGAHSNLTDNKASTCPDCGNIINESDHQCPNCGYPFENQATKTSIKIPLIIVAAAIVMGNLHTVIQVIHINQEVQKFEQWKAGRRDRKKTYRDILPQYQEKYGIDTAEYNQFERENDAYRATHYGRSMPYIGH